MTAQFPTTIPVYSNPTASMTLGSADHAGLHDNVNDDVVQIATKIGSGSSVPSAGTVFRGTGVGTSGWGALVNADVSATAGLDLSKLAPGIPEANPFLNPFAQINQRLGSVGVAMATDVVFIDGWRYRKSGAMVHTGSVHASSPTVSQSVPYSSQSIGLTCTTVDSSIAAGDFCTLGQSIEGFVWLPWYTRTVTLSFWVYGAVTGTHCVALRNYGTAGAADRSYIAEYTISAANTWEFKTITVSAVPSGGTWDLANGRGLEVTWALAAGSTYQTTAGAWNTGNFYATSNQVNECAGLTSFRIWAPKFTLGSFAVPAAFRPPGFEYNFIERYYEFSNNYTTPFRTTNAAPSFIVATSIPTGSYYLSPYFHVRKRATPAVATATWNDSGVTTLNASSNSSGTSFGTNSAVPGGANQNFFLVQNSSGGTLSAASGFAIMQWEANADTP